MANEVGRHPAEDDWVPSEVIFPEEEDSAVPTSRDESASVLSGLANFGSEVVDEFKAFGKNPIDHTLSALDSPWEGDPVRAFATAFGNAFTFESLDEMKAAGSTAMSLLDGSMDKDKTMRETFDIRHEHFSNQEDALSEANTMADIAGTVAAIGTGIVAAPKAGAKLAKAKPGASQALNAVIGKTGAANVERFLSNKSNYLKHATGSGGVIARMGASSTAGGIAGALEALMSGGDISAGAVWGAGFGAGGYVVANGGKALLEKLRGGNDARTKTAALVELAEIMNVGHTARYGEIDPLTQQNLRKAVKEAGPDATLSDVYDRFRIVLHENLKNPNTTEQAAQYTENFFRRRDEALQNFGKSLGAKSDQLAMSKTKFDHTIKSSMDRVGRQYPELYAKSNINVLSKDVINVLEEEAPFLSSGRLPPASAKDGVSRPMPVGNDKMLKQFRKMVGTISDENKGINLEAMHNFRQTVSDVAHTGILNEKKVSRDAQAYARRVYDKINSRYFHNPANPLGEEFKALDAEYSQLGKIKSANALGRTMINSKGGKRRSIDRQEAHRILADDTNTDRADALIHGVVSELVELGTKKNKEMTVDGVRAIANRVVRLREIFGEEAADKIEGEVGRVIMTHKVAEEVAKSSDSAVKAKLSKSGNSLDVAATMLAATGAVSHALGFGAARRLLSDKFYVIPDKVSNKMTEMVTANDGGAAKVIDELTNFNPAMSHDGVDLLTPGLLGASGGGEE